MARAPNRPPPVRRINNLGSQTLKQASTVLLPGHFRNGMLSECSDQKYAIERKKNPHQYQDTIARSHRQQTEPTPLNDDRKPVRYSAGGAESTASSNSVTMQE